MTDIDYSRLFRSSRGKEGDLIPLLQRVQAAAGFISEEAVERISGHLRISENTVYGVASFYAQFRFTAPGRHSIKICLGTACHVQGGKVLSDAVERELEVEPGRATADGRFDFQPVACLGCCALAPVVQVDEEIHSQMNVTHLREVLEKYE